MKYDQYFPSQPFVALTVNQFVWRGGGGGGGLNNRNLNNRNGITPFVEKLAHYL